MTFYGPLVLVLIANVALIPATLTLRVATGNEAWIDHQGPAWQALQRAEDRFGRADGFVVGVFAPDVLAREMQYWLTELRRQIAKGGLSR